MSETLRVFCFLASLVLIIPIGICIMLLVGWFIEKLFG